jgi:Erv1 / Alr family
MSELKRTVWGPALWSFLHTAAATADHPEQLVQLLRTLPFVLPCPECRSHVSEHYAAHPPEAITDAVAASRYLFRLHNSTNLRLGKQEQHPRVLHARHGMMLPEALNLSFSSSRLRPYRVV